MIRKKVRSGFPKKHALGLDPRDHAQTTIKSAMAIRPDRIAL